METDVLKSAIDVTKMTIDYINQYTQQLITLAVGILAISITFTKDIVKSHQKSPLWLLKSSWVVFLVSICCGLLTMRSVSRFSSIHLSTKNMSSGFPDLISEIGNRSYIYSQAQFLAFIIGLILLALYGAKSLKHPKFEINESDIGKD